MSDPEELTRFLGEFRRTLTGRGRYCRAIVDEIRAHLLDATAASGGGPDAAQAVLDFGDPQLVAAGFNDLRAERRTRRLQSAGAAVVASALGGVTILGLLDQPQSGLPVGAQGPGVPARASGTVDVAVIDPKTGRLMGVGQAASAVWLHPATSD